MSGIFNELLDINNKKSFIYNQKPTDDPFFYGPITLFKIYDELKETIKCKILETNITNKIKTNLTSNAYEFESFSKDLQTNIQYLQVKYIGYYADLEFKNSNKHYSFNWNNGLNYNSVLEIFDKILIINLKNRTDRKEHMTKQLNKFIISKDKVE